MWLKCQPGVRFNNWKLQMASHLEHNWSQVDQLYSFLLYRRAVSVALRCFLPVFFYTVVYCWSCVIQMLHHMLNNPPIILGPHFDTSHGGYCSYWCGRSVYLALSCAVAHATAGVVHPSSQQDSKQMYGRCVHNSATVFARSFSYSLETLTLSIVSSGWISTSLNHESVGRCLVACVESAYAHHICSPTSLDAVPLLSSSRYAEVFVCTYFCQNLCFQSAIRTRDLCWYIHGWNFLLMRLR